MPAPRPLPRSLVPLPGESLPGFLLRVSFRLGLAPGQLAVMTGLKPHDEQTRLAPGLIARIPEPVLPFFARMTRLTEHQAAQLGLAATWQDRYPVLTGASSRPGGRLVLSTRTVLTPATRFCPQCLAGDGSAVQDAFGGSWLKAWHLPVVFACPAHRRLLEHRCPGCGSTAGGPRDKGAGNSVLSALRSAGLHPAQCRAELIPAISGPRSRSCCGTRLDQAGCSRPASAGLISLQSKILGLLDPDGPATTVSAGTPAPPARYFSDLRVLGMLACATWPAARHLSPDESTASALDEHVAALNRDIAGHQGPAPPRSRPAFIPAMDSAVGAGLAGIADRILGGSPDEIRDQVKILLAGGRAENRASWRLPDPSRPAGPCSEGLYAACTPLLRETAKAGAPARTAAARARLRTQNAFRRDPVLHPARWGPENIPALLPEDWCNRYLMPVSRTGARPRIIRRTAALRLVQMTAGGSLDDAAEFLGIPLAIASRRSTTRTRITAPALTPVRRQPGPAGFDSALRDLAREFDAPAALPVNYRNRRQALETWSIDQDTWTRLTRQLPILRGPRLPDLSECLRQAASIYVWTKLTSGEHSFAPRPVEDAQPPEIQNAWRQGRRNYIWSRIQTRPGRYATLRTKLDDLAASLAWTIDESGLRTQARAAKTPVPALTWPTVANYRCSVAN